MLGALAGALGSLMALEAIREIVGGFGDDDRGMVGRLLMIDTRSMRFETLTYGWDETNPLNGTQRRVWSIPVKHVWLHFPNHDVERGAALSANLA